jgi:tetratricopeptide (TPR) repeat protein
MDPKASGIGFELAYALNAQGGFARAATIAEIALDRDPTSVLTCKELGYARLRLGRFEDASKTYSLCLDLATKSKGVNDRTSVDRKFMFEILFSLAHAYRGMGQTESCRQSLQDAANWAPAEAPRLPDPAGCAGR